MRMTDWAGAVLVLVALVSLMEIAGCGWGTGGGSGADAGAILPLAGESEPDLAARWLVQHYDQYHSTFGVYRDADSAGNHFFVWHKLASPGGEGLVPAMDDRWRDGAAEGTSCLRCEFVASGNNWGGWMFQNGFFPPAADGSQVNWGTVPDAGIDLTAGGGTPKRLLFRARGSVGGERVEFYMGGVGRDPVTGLPLAGCPFPDSAPRVSTGFLTLTAGWHEYSLALPVDLSYVIAGFGWSTSAEVNGGQSITFFLDDIRYDRSTVESPHFAVSYQAETGLPVDTMLMNAASLYDNALLTMAFLTAGERERAVRIAEAMLTALDHDRTFTDGRLYDWYCGGDLTCAPGWLANGKPGTVRLPGWYNPGTRQYEELQALLAHHPGNNAFALLALLEAAAATGERRFLEGAVRIGTWIEAAFRDDGPGGGYRGGLESGAPAPDHVFRFKATESNIDLTAAFQGLAQATGDPVWAARAAHARAFVESMWNADEGFFYTGTLDDGVTPNREVVPQDVHSWAFLLLGADRPEYARALDWVEARHRTGEGYDFDTDRDGVWWEGTCHMRLAWALAGRPDRAAELDRILAAVVEAGGGALPAADRNGVTTGFAGWSLYNRRHVGATAWYLLAAHGYNPFRPRR